MKMGAALRFVRHFVGIESSVESEGSVPMKRASSDSAKVVVRGGGVVLSNVPLLVSQLAESRIPGLSVGVPMNSTPAASKADCTSCSVVARPGGTPSPASNLLIVWTPTPARVARTSADHRRAALLARICIPVITARPLTMVSKVS